MVMLGMGLNVVRTYAKGQRKLQGWSGHLLYAGGMILL